MSFSVEVDLGERSYKIDISSDFSGLPPASDGAAALLVSDSNVDPLYGDNCAAVLTEGGYNVCRAVVPAGESTKSMQYALELYDAALAGRLDRKSFVVALGGGVVGDLAGFAAATYLRGVNLIQVPTSLLAMVDSSVGGKTAVNLPQGKNLVGVFYQPRRVAINLKTLDTLPDREYFSGLAEVVKYGVIMDAAFFGYLEEHKAALLRRDYDVLQRVVARCCEIKADVVRQDEREGGLRAILNFGHTLGHAVENNCGYGTLLHGEAVAVGMAYAARLSVRCHGLAQDDADRIIALLADLRLPVGRDALPGDLQWPQLRRAITADKKTLRSVPAFVLASEIGKVAFGCRVDEDDMADCWNEL